MNFKEWILQFLDEDSPRGDLANDIKRYNRFPETNSKRRMLDHLHYRNACLQCIEAFEEAWEEYRRYI